MEKNLGDLLESGQSPWYDNIDRNIIQNGALKQLFDKGVTGVTSNPSIFEQAITGSAVYDDDVRALAGQGKSIQEIYDTLTVQDIQSAADLLRGVYDRTEGGDGYVSLEVLPDYADDATKTIENARALHRLVERPNLMIKVPGTRSGLEAIRVLTAEGFNVNVTLLFSVGHYEAAAAAYIEGLEQRRKEGLPVNKVCSVASVFISRVDTAVDAILEQRNKTNLQGRAAVANAKMIYQRFKELFYGGGFEELSTAGAPVQRVLWASTSTKNPAYRDVKYVEDLVGRDTVNTIPHNTLEAIIDHGEITETLEDDLDQARALLKELADLGIDLDGICDTTQRKGIEAFSASFKTLMNAIAIKAGN